MVYLTIYCIIYLCGLHAYSFYCFSSFYTEHQQLQHISLGQTRWKTPFHNFVSGNRREKSLEIWHTLNKELLEERAVLLDGKEFFHIWQAQRRPVLKDVFLFETGGDSFNLWVPISIVNHKNTKRLRIFPRTQKRQSNIVWARPENLFNWHLDKCSEWKTVPVKR
jgi:hypothetical protein